MDIDLKKIIKLASIYPGMLILHSTINRCPGGQIVCKRERRAEQRNRLTVPEDSNVANKLDSPLNKIPLENMVGHLETAQSSSGSQTIAGAL